MIKIIYCLSAIIFGIFLIYNEIHKKKCKGITEGSSISIGFGILFFPQWITQINNSIHDKEYDFLTVILLFIISIPFIYIATKRITISNLDRDEIVPVVIQVLNEFNIGFIKREEDNQLSFYDSSSAKEIIKLTSGDSKFQYIKVFDWWKETNKRRLMKAIVKLLRESQSENIQTKPNRFEQTIGVIFIIIGILLLPKSL